MKQFILITSFLATFLTNAQTQKEEFNTRIKAGTGVFIPQGKLQDFLGTSPYFEVSLDASFFGHDNFGFSLQFVVPNQQKDFLYETIYNETENVKATYMANILFNFRKRFSETEKSAFEFRLGFGASGLQTDLRNPRYSGNKDENKYEMISSFLLNPNIEYIRKFKNKTALNFAIGLHYSPYKVEGAVQEDIGGLGIIPKITYTF